MISTNRLRAVRPAEQPERAGGQTLSAVRRIVAALWPRLAAIALVLLAWQTLVWLHWRPVYVLPGPVPVFGRLWSEARAGTLATAVEVTMQRALIGYTLALLVGGVVGLAIARVSLLRRAIASLIAGLQSMPSVAWFPLAILLFRLSESAIVFVVVLGAAPSIASALLAAVDHIPPGLVRAGRSLGAGRVRLYTDVLLPAALPDLLAGMKQAWAFAWRSLLAGELLVVVAHRPSLGARLEFARDFSDAQGLLAWMIVILIIGIAVDSLIFAPAQRRLRLTRGLLDRDAAA